MLFVSMHNCRQSCDAYYQLVLYPVNASSNLYEMYYAVAMNRHLAEKDLRANQYADQVKECFTRRLLLQVEYNEVIADGKWAHMMDQPRIGYTSWQQPSQHHTPCHLTSHRRRQQKKRFSLSKTDMCPLKQKICPSPRERH